MNKYPTAAGILNLGKCSLSPIGGGKRKEPERH